MTFRNLLISASLIASAPVFAATYYVTPKGAGEMTGADEANALSVQAFVDKAPTCENGDTFYFAAGTYLLPKTATFENKGVYLIGSTEGRTIFSGDLNGDGRPSGANKDTETPADLKCLVFIKAASSATTTPARPASIENIEFTCAYQTSQNSGDSAQGALSICNTWEAAVKNCKFYSNWADGSYGGPALYSNRSNVELAGCVFSGNSAAHRGGAVRLVNDNPAKGTYIFNNCVFNGNRSYGTRGGAICVMAAKQVNISNSVFVNNKAKSMGSAIFLDVDYTNTASEKISLNAMQITNTTIAGNTTVSSNADDVLADNGQIYVDRRSNRSNSLTMQNSIVVSSQDITKDIYAGVADGNAAADCKFTFKSEGYNVVGTTYAVGDDADSASAGGIATADSPSSVFTWESTDHVGSEYTYEYVFGDNTLNDDNQLLPVTFIEGKDGKTPGAVALDLNEVSTGVDDILGGEANGSLTLLGNNLYRIEGAAYIEAYTVSGVQVAAVAGDTIDLGNLNGGIYIICANGNSYKVISDR